MSEFKETGKLSVSLSEHKAILKKQKKVKDVQAPLVDQIFCGFKQRVHSFCDIDTEGLAKKTIQYLDDYYSKNIVPASQKSELNRPDYLKIFQPEEKVNKKHLFEALRKGQYDLDKEEELLSQIKDHTKKRDQGKIAKILQ